MDKPNTGPAEFLMFLSVLCRGRGWSQSASAPLDATKFYTMGLSEVILTGWLLGSDAKASVFDGLGVRLNDQQQVAFVFFKNLSYRDTSTGRDKMLICCFSVALPCVNSEKWKTQWHIIMLPACRIT